MDDITSPPETAERKLTRAEKLELKSQAMKDKQEALRLRSRPWYRKKREKERQKTIELKALKEKLQAIQEGAPISMLDEPVKAHSDPMNRSETDMEVVKIRDFTPAVIPDDLPDDTFVERIAKQPAFKETVGGANTEDPRVTKFLKMIGELQNRSFTWCARSCGLTNSDLARIWRDANLSEAFFRVVNQIPAIADKMVDDAMGALKSCPRCDGLGTIDIPPAHRKMFSQKEITTCPNCKGKRVVRTVGSIPDKQIIFEKIGWVKQGKGVSVQVNMNSHGVDATVSEMDGIEGEVLEHRP